MRDLQCSVFYMLRTSWHFIYLFICIICTREMEILISNNKNDN